MLVKFFKHGNMTNPTGGRSGGGGAVRDYLLGKDGKPRDGATLVRGNADITTQIINASKNKKIYTSGVISFSESEYPTAQAKHDLMADFEATLFNGLDPDQYSGYWVEHQDKDRTELHFVFANTELTTGKALPVYFHATDLDLVNSWAKVTIDKYGFIDPNHPEHQRDLAPTTVFDFDKEADKDNEFEQAHEPKKLNNQQLKEQITNRLLAEIDSKPDIKSQADIIKTLQGMGHEVTRWGKTENKKGKADKSQEYISIKNPNGGQNLKLKGALFSPDFTRKDLPRYKEQRIADYKANHDKRIAGYQSDLATQLQKRKDYLQKRFPLDRKPVDNDLTRKLAEIQRAGEAKYTRAKETLAQYENRTLDPYDLSHYTAYEPTKLEAEQQAQLKVIADIEYRVVSGDDLTALDEAEYSQAKAFTNSFDTILAEQQAEQKRSEQARLEAIEAQRLAEAQRKQSITNNRLNRLQSIVTEATQKLIDSLPRDPERLQTIKALHEILLQEIEDRVRNNPDMTDKEFELEVSKYTDSKEHIASVPVVEKQIQAQAQHEAQLAEQTAYIAENAVGFVTDKARAKFEALSDNLLDSNKIKFEKILEPLQAKLDNRELLSRDELADYCKFNKGLNTIADITQNRIIERSNPLSEAKASTTAPEVKQAPIEQSAPPKPLKLWEQSLKARIAYQTVLNVIEAMPDVAEKRMKLSELKKSFDNMTQQQIDKLPDIKSMQAGHGHEVDITRTQDKGQGR